MGDMFGHILRRNENIPAYIAMKRYFYYMLPPRRGAKVINLPILDLTRIGKSLNCMHDLVNIRELAQNRDK